MKRTFSHAKRASWLLASLLLAQACDQVGAPLVDKTKPGVSIPFATCSAAPECIAPEPVERQLRLTLRVDLALCGGLAGGDLDECPQLAPGTTPLPGDPVDASGDFDGGVPDEVVAGGDAKNIMPGVAPCGGSSDRPLPQQLTCSAAISRNAPVRSPERLREAHWTDANVSVESDVPRTIVLEQPSLKNVFIELRGPVTLRIEQGMQLGPLQVAGAATQAGAPRLELEGVTAEELVVGDDRNAFPGAIAVRNTRLLVLQLFADELTFESTALEKGSLAARTLVATDVELEDIGLSVERALFSSAHLSSSQFSRCGDLTFVAARLFATDLPACSGPPVRLFQSSVVEGALDGVFQSDGPRFAGVRFGTRTATELHTWGGSFIASSFCAQVQQLTVGRDAEIKCGFCSSLTFARDALCTLPKGEVGFDLNVCLDITKDTVPEQCPEPFPVLERAIGDL